MNKQLKGLLAAVLIATTGLMISCTKKSDSNENVINFPLISNLKGLDPAQAGDLYSNTVIAQIFERLYSYNYLKRPLELEPRLAETLPLASKDGLTHTIKIRKGILFQNDPAFPEGKGREVKAKDFIFSWKRIADAEVNSEGWWIFDGRIKGLNEWREAKKEGKANYDTEVEGLQALDDYTIKITLTKPYYQLYYVLTMNYAAVMAKEVVDKYGKEIINHPVGTGPYRLENWIRNNKATLVKNETWAGQTYPSEGEEGDDEKGLLKDAGKKLPFVDKIVFHEIVEDQPRWLNFMKGNLDIVAIPKDNFDSSIAGGALTDDMKTKGIRLMVTEEPDVTYTAFNMEDPILGKNKKLRQAMSLAYNGAEVINKFYNNRAIPAQSPIPPGVDGYDKKFDNPFKGFDLAKAKKLLEEAGHPNGKDLPEIEFSATSSTTATQMAEYFKENMSELGIKVKIVQNSWPQFTKKIREKRAQMYGIAWGADYPDAENFLQLLYGKNVSPGANGANYVNPTYDKLYKKAALMAPGPERTKIYQKMRDIIVEDTPWILGAHRLGYRVYHGWVKNYKRHAIIDDYFKYLKVDAAEKKAIKGKL